MFSSSISPPDPYPSHLLFTPVPQPRAHASGWTPDRQRAFIMRLSQVGVVAAAARSVGMTPRSAHQLRARSGAGSSFAQAWTTALEQGQMIAIDIAHERCFEPIREVIYRGRVPVGLRERLNNVMLYAALRGADGGYPELRRDTARPAQQSFNNAQRKSETAGKTGKRR